MDWLINIFTQGYLIKLSLNEPDNQCGLVEHFNNGNFESNYEVIIVKKKYS